MSWLSRFSLAQRALIGLMSVIALAFGAIAIPQLKQQLLPTIELPVVSVLAPYQGASPDVVEKQVVEPLEAHLRLVSISQANVVGTPGNAAGEISDLDGRFAVELALDVPVQHLRLGVREGGVQHVELIDVRQELELHARWIDQGVGPRELERVDPLLEGNLACFADERDVLAVVNRELDRIAAGNGGQIALPAR